MQALLLAAGTGSRMFGATAGSHKSLCPVGGRSILARLVDDLLALGASRVNVLTGHCADGVVAHLGEMSPQAPLRFIHNERFATTNNVVSVALAAGQIEPGEDIVLVDGDLVFGPGVLARLDAPAENVALVDHYHPTMPGSVVSVSGGRITAVHPMAERGPGFDYAGRYKTVNAYRFSQRFWSEQFAPLVTHHAQQVDANAFYEAALNGLPDLAAADIRAEILDGAPWIEVDEPRDLDAAQALFGDQSRHR